MARVMTLGRIGQTNSSARKRYPGYSRAGYPGGGGVPQEVGPPYAYPSRTLNRLTSPPVTPDEPQNLLRPVASGCTACGPASSGLPSTRYRPVNQLGQVNGGGGAGTDASEPGLWLYGLSAAFAIGTGALLAPRGLGWALGGATIAAVLPVGAYKLME